MYFALLQKKKIPDFSMSLPLQLHTLQAAIICFDFFYLNNSPLQF